MTNSENGSEMTEGACNCGAIRFTVAGTPTDVYVCHCSICRRASGGNGIAVVVVPNEKFSWASGEEFITSWKKPDADWEMWFCRRCGSPVPGTNDKSRKFVPAGLIKTGAEKLTVKHHIWVGSKAPWDEIGDSGRQHTEAFEA